MHLRFRCPSSVANYRLRNLITAHESLTADHRLTPLYNREQGRGSSRPCFPAAPASPGRVVNEIPVYRELLAPGYCPESLLHQTDILKMIGAKCQTTPRTGGSNGALLPESDVTMARPIRLPATLGLRQWVRRRRTPDSRPGRIGSRARTCRQGSRRLAVATQSPFRPAPSGGGDRNLAGQR